MTNTRLMHVKGRLVVGGEPPTLLCVVTGLLVASCDAAPVPAPAPAVAAAAQALSTVRMRWGGERARACAAAAAAAAHGSSDACMQRSRLTAHVQPPVWRSRSTMACRQAHACCFLLGLARVECCLALLTSVDCAGSLFLPTRVCSVERPRRVFGSSTCG